VSVPEDARLAAGLPVAGRSYTVTETPLSASAYAVARPTMPAPITATSAPVATNLPYSNLERLI
jgi:hypothetical protein